ncbi:MAG: helix-hairpin-helix domain-containing protein, partial [Clostridia bacterium]|nr:helix-hairpin-helix domain-containing protein [Clostridia bacterium]
GSGYYDASWKHAFVEDNDWKSEDQMCVYVTGAVQSSGVYGRNYGTRLNELLELACLQKSADLSQFNLAEILEDEAKIIIPEVGWKTADSKAAPTGLININTASQEELESLTGIGEALASRIINYRQTNGNFLTKEEIKNVSGIGDKKYEALADSITVN